MKKVLVFLFAFVFAVCFVNAEVTVDGSSNQNVTVGDVETPVYEVSVMWGSMVFDWAYLTDTGEYGWKIHPECVEMSGMVGDEEFFNQYIEEGKTLYSDDVCTVEKTTYNTGDKYYELQDPEPFIRVEDMSTGGKVTPSIDFSANNKYDFTTLAFKYYGMNAQYNTLNTSTLPADARFCSSNNIGQSGNLECNEDERFVYSISIELGVDSSKTVTTPTTGETIGTITLTFASN